MVILMFREVHSTESPTNNVISTNGASEVEESESLAKNRSRRGYSRVFRVTILRWSKEGGVLDPPAHAIAVGKIDCGKRVGKIAGSLTTQKMDA